QRVARRLRTHRRWARYRQAVSTLCLGIEEQRLADDRLNRVGLEWLRDEERWLRTFTGKKLIRIGGNKDHWYIEGLNDFIDGVEAGATVGKLDIGQHQTRSFLAHGRNSFLVRACNFHYPVTKTFDQALEIHGNDWLILNNEDVRSDLLCDFATSLGQQIRHGAKVRLEDQCCLLGREAFDGNEQENLPGSGCDGG